jgi:predicted RNA binding protein YcfA (HicA-like mRNA interferase family)
MLATGIPRRLRIADFQATFNPDGTIMGVGPAALDTLVTIRNTSSEPTIAHFCVRNEHEEAVFDFNIELKGLDVQSFSVASMLRGDLRALAYSHSREPKHEPFPTASLFQTLCRLSSGYPPNGLVDNVIRNPIHGYITIDHLHNNGRGNSLRADYLIGKPGSFVTDLGAGQVKLTLPDYYPVVYGRTSSPINPDSQLVELALSDDPAVVYSRASWRGLGVVLKETQMKVRDAIRLIESDGWYHVVSKGSHRQYKHPQKPGRVTIPGKFNDDLAAGTFNSILKQAGLKP